MYRLSTDKTMPGMKLGQSIYSASGNLLLAKHTILTPKVIVQLKQHQISSLYIESEFPGADLQEPIPIVQEKTRIQAIRTIQNAFSKCRLASTRKIEIQSFKSTINSIIENVLNNRHTLIQSSDIRKYDEYTFAHCVNVCVLSTMIGALLNYSPKRLYELSLGALLHDIGKTQIPLSILNKPKKLTDEEFEIIQAHPEIGFELLRQTQNFSVVPMHAAFQHHEKFDGSGYPRRLKGSEIHEYARIVAIADVYDALTSNRPYKTACTPDIAYRIMTEESVGHFDCDLLNLFFEHVAIYPVGTIVKLFAGYCAVVTNVRKGLITTPQIRLISDPHRRILRYPTKIDLKDADDNYQIKRVLRDEELVDLFLTAKADHLAYHS